MSVADVISVNEPADLLKEIIKIPSIRKDETKVAEIIIDILEKEGIQTYELIESTPGRGNLIVDIAGGKGDGFNLGIIGHLDVVPVESEWDVDPFGGVERDGYIYGRGAIDDKGQVAAMVYLAVFLSRINREFKGKVRLFMVADEESQDPNHGMRYLIKNRKDLFKDIHGAIGELGGLVSFQGERRQALVFGEEGAVTLKVIAKGHKGHASQTYKIDSSIKQIARATISIPDGVFFISRPTKIMLKKLLGWKSIFLTNKLTNGVILRMLSDLDTARMLHALTHITIAKTALHGGEAENVYPEETELTLDIRFFPEQNDLRGIFNIIEKSLPRGKYKIKKVNYMPSTYSPTNTPLYKAIEKTIRDLGYKPLPIIQTGSSDSAWVRSIGIPTYHFMITKKPLEIHTIHGTNERIWKEDLISIIEGYWRLIQNLEKQPLSET